MAILKPVSHWASFLLLFLLLPINSNAQVPDQIILVDFGPNNGSDGLSTNGTDVNGNQWTNFTNPFLNGSPIELSDINNEATSYLVEVFTAMDRKGIQDGGLLNPENDLLGELAVATATQDFFFTTDSGAIAFTNLDPNNGYRFSLFGSQNSMELQQTKYRLSGYNSVEVLLQTSGTDLGGEGYHGNTDSVSVTPLVFPDTEGQIRLHISAEMGSEAHLNALKIEEFINAEPCVEIDDHKITVMGSSVAKGQGATDFAGYAFQYTQLLEERFINGQGQDWQVSNISVGGNNTNNVLNRWDSDLVPECGKYVIYGLSLANEGIQNGGQTVFNQFNTNMQTLIDLAIDRGMTPVIMNTYPRASFGPIQHEFLKDMNLIIHEWDVPSVNLLGALDNGNGQWASAYSADAGHPNNAGHTEFFYSMVPSLFDAIDSGKPQPQKVSGTFIQMGNTINSDHLVFSPENIVHSFTTSFDFKTSAAGALFAIKDENETTATLRIDGDGHLNYRANTSQDVILGNDIINDNNWHKLTLTHFFARGETLLYMDSTLVGNFSEQLVPQTFYLNYLNTIPEVAYRDYFMYRSGMNEKEITALSQGRMLKSSLELYAPLDGQAVLGNAPLINLAQSTNALTSEMTQSLNQTEIDEKSHFALFPNPVQETLFIKSADDKNIDSITLRDVLGRNLSWTGDSSNIHFSNFPSGVYFISIYYQDTRTANFKIIRR